MSNMNISRMKFSIININVADMGVLFSVGITVRYLNVGHVFFSRISCQYESEFFEVENIIKKTCLILL